MLPATLARGRAVARGYGELLMLNPGVPALTAYRYSPYTVPSSAAAALAAVAASPATSATARAPPALPLTCLSLQIVNMLPFRSDCNLEPANDQLLSFFLDFLFYEYEKNIAVP